ncbi:MAG TPA: hypothetical protein VM100_06250 [Longimicrobiales bacterium]|nr:hypothetical protein [Longimicrobiales bacterium]
MRSAKWKYVVLGGVVVAITAFGQSVKQQQRGHYHGAPVTIATVQQGRAIILHHGCPDCHGGYDNPDKEGWLAGIKDTDAPFKIGPCVESQPCWETRPRNLTPDNATGLGRFTERQIFNAIRHGLRPGETPDVTITGDTPGKGNFPDSPKYLAPPMPWPSFRHMPDADIWAIATYLKHGLKPVSHKVKDSDGPPDFWASTYAEMNGASRPVKFPTAREAFTR